MSKDRPFFEILREERPDVAEALSSFVSTLMAQPALDEKVKQLIYVGIATAVDHTRGVEVHARRARDLGATREEILEAMLLSIPAAGLAGISKCLAVAMAAIEESSDSG
jgi:AhpD family alkylhydroperoxidase